MTLVSSAPNTMAAAFVNAAQNKEPPIFSLGTAPPKKKGKAGRANQRASGRGGSRTPLGGMRSPTKSSDGGQVPPLFGGGQP